MSEMIARVSVGIVAAAISVGLGAPASAATSVPMRNAELVTSASVLPYGPDTCMSGFVWREARPSDHVCVGPDVRQTTREENALAASRREPNGGPYGPDTCKPGFVWREAFDGDVVCVHPDRRTQAKSDNAAVASRMESSATQAGTHTVTLGVAQSRPAGALKEFDTVLTDCDAGRVLEGSAPSVGWGQEEDGCNHAIVAQRAVQFDTAPLDRIPGKRIDRAVLTYDENGDNCGDPPRNPLPGPFGPLQPCWRGGDGEAQHKANGCVVVRVPAKPWIGTSTKELRPHVTHPSGQPKITRNSPRAWDVTVPFQWQTDPQSKPLDTPVQPPLNPGFGFLLTGEITSLDQLTGDDDTYCLSRVANVQLQVTYTVVPRGKGPIVK